MEDSVQVFDENVRVSDVATVWTADSAISSKIKHLVLYRFEAAECDKKQVIGLLWLTRAVMSYFPDCVVVPHGESDCVVEFVDPKTKAAQNGFGQKLKVFSVSVICLFGSAFSIMAFHNDISVTNIFTEFYELVTGNSSSGFTVLEVSYSIGLLLGIIIFYNHVGKKKTAQEPTPIEVSMRNYERDMDDAVVKRCDREGKKIDVV